MKCNICKSKIGRYDGNHVYNCAKNNNINKDKKQLKYELIKFNYPDISKKEVLKNEYSINLMSLPDLKTKYGINYNLIKFLLEWYHIPKRTIKESANLISKKKYVKTCNEKYGVDNVSQLKEIKNKKKETFLKNYGVDNIWKTKEFRDALNIHMIQKYGKKSVPDLYGNQNPFNIHGISLKEKNKRIKKANEAYKKYWENLDDDKKTEIILKRVKNSNNKIIKPSKLEERISKILKENFIEHHPQFWINRKSFDFRIKNTNLIIEVNGDFWHANPKLYHKNDILNHPQKKITAGEIWEKDRKKKDLCNQYGYRVVYIWEFDINNMNDDQILEFILENVEENKN